MRRRRPDAMNSSVATALMWPSKSPNHSERSTDGDPTSEGTRLWRTWADQRDLPPGELLDAWDNPTNPFADRCMFEVAAACLMRGEPVYFSCCEAWLRTCCSTLKRRSVALPLRSQEGGRHAPRAHVAVPLGSGLNQRTQCEVDGGHQCADSDIIDRRSRTAASPGLRRSGGCVHFDREKLPPPPAREK